MLNLTEKFLLVVVVVVFSSFSVHVYWHNMLFTYYKRIIIVIIVSIFFLNSQRSSNCCWVFDHQGSVQFRINHMHLYAKGKLHNKNLCVIATTSAKVIFQAYYNSTNRQTYTNQISSVLFVYHSRRAQSEWFLHQLLLRKSICTYVRDEIIDFLDAAALISRTITQAIYVLMRRESETRHYSN